MPRLPSKRGGLWSRFLAGLGVPSTHRRSVAETTESTVRVWLDAAQVSASDLRLPVDLEAADLVVVPLPHDRVKVGEWLASRGMLAVVERDHRDHALAALARSQRCAEVVWSPTSAGWRHRVRAAGSAATCPTKPAA